MAGGMTLPSRHDHQSEGRRVVEDDIEEGSVDVQLAVVVNEAQPLPERLDWRCALQRGYLNAALLIDPLASDHRVVSSAGSVY
ncbi:MAG: hypothetical protein EWM73_00330 [Nitrospira sp.]|nr:MAG: hypothetical protein EWM73_00330 [Nitrospira sp.]